MSTFRAIKVIHRAAEKCKSLGIDGRSFADALISVTVATLLNAGLAPDDAKKIMEEAIDFVAASMKAAPRE